MEDGSDRSGTVAGAAGQAIAAVALVSALALGFWVMAKPGGRSSAAPKPATCSNEDEYGKKNKAAGRVSGAELCAALNRKDLATLLGTPTEIPKAATGGDSSIGSAGGRDIPTPSARIEFDTYTVNLEATYDGRPVALTAGLFDDPQKNRTFHSHRAVLYSDRTISFSFRLDGGESSSAPGVPARVLSVAQDARDKGGSYELTLWREDGGVPDDTVLFDVAERVLPSIPGWNS
ncbi:DUF6215 domain-containing protein [Streptomyces sp. NPDC016845]|uniref:DUF6215 domain-containing protein n=1 Tax=Streptomyces sp. NPDC016845 TaxID=3364972 RepID=UPI00378C6EB9